MATSPNGADHRLRRFTIDSLSHRFRFTAKWSANRKLVRKRGSRRSMVISAKPTSGQRRSRPFRASLLFLDPSCSTRGAGLGYLATSFVSTR